MTSGKFVEPEHVGYRYLRNSGGKKIRSLIGCDCNESSAVGSSQCYKMLAIRESFLMQELSSSYEIIKTLLSILLNSGDMPLFAELTTASNIGDNIHTAEVIHKDQVHEIELRRLWIAEAAVAVQNSWNWSLRLLLN